MESVQDMEQLLEGLRQMKTSNPEVFKQAMQSLGLPTDSAAPSLLEENDSLLKMAEAIKMMKSSGGDSDVIGGDDLIMSKNKPTQPKGITITPTPGFCFKTQRVADSLKIFINIAQHELVDEPTIKKKLDDKGEEVEGMNIPMSVGQPRYGKDKKGAKSLIYDIIVNPVVVSEAKADKTGKYREFIVQLGMQYLEQKYKEELSKKYTLPNLKYKFVDEGVEGVATQLIQDRKSMPKIQEVSSSQASKTGTKPAAKTLATRAVAEIPDRDLEYAVTWLVDSLAKDGVGALVHVPGTAELLPERYSSSAYELQVLEYLDPIHQPAPSTVAVVITADIASYELNVPGVQISISPYRVSLKLPGHKKVTIHLACVVQPSTSYYTLRRPYEGCLSSVQVQVVLRVDHADWAETADAGSKAWLLSQALSSGDQSGKAEENPYGLSTTSKARTTPSAADDDDDDDERLAEDKFHLSLPDDVDPYTGIKMEGDDPFSKPRNAKIKPAVKASPPPPREENPEEQELPEDRFHKKDASSAYLINQREQAKKDKWAKHEKEKLERANDPNVEYVDMDDFRAGGKYGAKEAPKEENLLQSAQNEELRRAAEVVATSVGNQASGGLSLSSSLWTELLD